MDSAPSQTEAAALTEEWFLAEIGRAGVDVAAILFTLEDLRAGGQPDRAESWAEILQVTLAERQQVDDALRVLERRAAWAESPAGAASNWAQEALDVLGASWEQKTLVEQAGFDKGLPGRESVRRLRLMRGLQPGALCYDRTWGLGEVTQVDFFYQKVHIDFERKIGHQLSLAYAGEALDLVGEDHILVLKKRHGDELKRLIADNPADVVRRTLRSFGPLTVSQLQERLSPAIVAEADWKRFWEQARKALKKDSLLHFPVHKNDALRFLERPRSHDEEWFDRFSKERDLEKLIGALEDLAGRTPPGGVTDAQRPAVENRVAFAIKGVTDRQRGLLARTIMAGRSLGMEASILGDGMLFFQPDVFTDTMRQLPARLARGFLEHLQALDADRTTRLLCDLLPAIDIGSLGEILDYLADTGRESAAAAVVRATFENRVAGIEVLSWLSRHMEKVGAWKLGSFTGVILQMLDALDESYSGDKLKAQNQLRERFIKPEWLKDVLSALDMDQRRKVLLRIKDSKGWPALDRQSLLAQIIKLYPEFEDLFATRVVKTTQTQRGPVTSYRSYQERQAQLQKIVNVEIPKVAKDIALARSYGDLRENFEYKAAKENQTILFHRRDELHEMLRTVRPTDFAECSSEQVGLGTGVLIEYGDGRREQYYILGEWDSDPAIGIISCTSRMAQALESHRAGEQVAIPAEHGETTCRIVAVTPLTDEVKDWAREP
jgi:transcription elongation GreA/GreB family factor